MRFLRYAGFLLAFAVPVILQIRDPIKFIGIALLAWFPVQIAFTASLQFVYPPRITLYKFDTPFDGAVSLHLSRKHEEDKKANP